MQTSIFSVDVEDWFHLLDDPSVPAIDQWASLPSYVERDFSKLLDLFSEKDVQVTCFFLGWVAERFPHLVKEAASRGHEVASHGYGHRLVYELSRTEFYEDVRGARLLLEDIAGVEVVGYRAPGFSTTDETPWFFDALAEAGYQYDSSVFPAQRGHGGMPGGRREPHRIGGHEALLEVPITVSDLLGKPMCFFGGGYLRLFPYWLIRKMALQVLSEGRPVVFYVHPREIDPAHPRLPMSPIRRFKSYVNLDTTEAKLRRILQDFPVTTFKNLLSNYPQLANTHVA
ncbi:MAG TPA: XrtA system polysaccharide deacetylase [Terriglobales bacterium]|jgi:polysaccharide deacetylase family protein (PEP-CTERM system associated)